MTNETYPTIHRYDVESIMNVTEGDNMFVKLVRFVSNPNPEVKQPFDYIPGIMILITIFTIIFLSMKIRGVSTTAAFFSASLVNFITALLLYPLEVISGTIFVSCIAMLVLSIGWAWLDVRS